MRRKQKGAPLIVYGLGAVLIGACCFFIYFDLRGYYHPEYVSTLQYYIYISFYLLCGAACCVFVPSNPMLAYLHADWRICWERSGVPLQIAPSRLAPSTRPSLRTAAAHFRTSTRRHERNSDRPAPDKVLYNYFFSVLFIL